MTMKNPTCLQIKEHISKKIDRWQFILNNNYKDDAESSMIDYAKGQLNAYIEVLEFINLEEKLNERKRIAEETRGIDESVGEVRESPLHKI